MVDGGCSKCPAKGREIARQPRHQGPFGEFASRRSWAPQRKGTPKARIARRVRPQVVPVFPEPQAQHSVPSSEGWAKLETPSELETTRQWISRETLYNLLRLSFADMRMGWLNSGKLPNLRERLKGSPIFANCYSDPPPFERI